MIKTRPFTIHDWRIETFDANDLRYSKHSMFDIFNDDKYYYLFLIYTKQPISGYMTLRKTLHIKKVNKAF